MTVQTSYIRPEDDPASWFTAQEIAGPAIVTAITGGIWQLYDRVPAPGEQPDEPIAEFSEVVALHKFFVPAGHLLRTHPANELRRQHFVSGYRLSY